MNEGMGTLTVMTLRAGFGEGSGAVELVEPKSGAVVKIAVRRMGTNIGGIRGDDLQAKRERPRVGKRFFDEPPREGEKRFLKSESWGGSRADLRNPWKQS